MSEAPATRFRRVLVVTGDHSLPDPSRWDGRYAADDLALHEEMKAALGSLEGYGFEFLTEHHRLLDEVRLDPPEFVLNFCDTGFGNVATRELNVPALLEILGIPYSGAPPAAMVLAWDKAIVRLIAQSLSVPVPDEVLLAPDESIDALQLVFPLLIKPAQGDGSVGITRDAVVHGVDEARAYLDWFRRELPGRDALLQEFLSGTEYGLALVGNPETGFADYPPLEVDYSALPEGLAPILAFESKTGPATPYESVAVVPARLEAARVAELRRHAERLFARLQCRDYARFDFRTGADGEIKLMEVNPNPAWSSTGKLALMAGFAGQSYAEMLATLLETAQRRLARGGA
ncbi:MAG: D-alanine--D-alanine ligase [Thermoanaerobaculia bacterium]|nr:D-alanine--D-alanine ligase [Thermoanaerobaculia bacterium]